MYNLNYNQLATKRRLLYVYRSVLKQIRQCYHHGEPKAGLNFHTSQIKLHGGGRKNEIVQTTEQLVNSTITTKNEEDDLPF